MKRYIKYLLLPCMALFTACSDFLEEDPQSFLSPDSFYKTIDDINAGLSAVYRAPQDRYSNNWAGENWFEWATDISEITDKNNWAHHNEIARLPSTFNASSSIPHDFWKYTYNHIKDANNLLKALPNVEVDETKKKQIEGQLKALRAFLYFDAVRVYNGTPLLLEASTDLEYFKTVRRATPEEMYDAIIKDLEYAITVLPERWSDAVDQGRITNGAAAAMLARVYLAMAGYPLNKVEYYEKARQLLYDFVEGKKYGSYSLFEEYADAFDEDKAPGNEGIWMVNFTKGSFGQGSDFHTNFAPLELYYAAGLGLTYGGGWSNGVPTERFYNSYDKINDKRFKYTYWTSTADIPEEYNDIVPKDANGEPEHISFYRPHVKKFREKTPNDNSLRSGLDHYVIRYADVLLMYAEVLNELSSQDCYKYINIVRARAGLDPLVSMSKDKFKECIMLERAWELCFEGDRKFDLLRWGVYSTRTPEWNPQVKGNIQVGKHEFWPIPRAERDINENLEQNPKW